MPKAGDIVHVGNAASVQFGEGRHLLFRVIRVMQPETQNTYSGWAWLEGYELNADGDAVERRSIFVQIAGLRQVGKAPDPRARRRTNTPPVPKPRTAPTTITTTRSTR